ncbi:chaperonin 10-like protein [Pyrenochaeta sp. MPI-SDFR-AT-0127]|nr:chaperonin 10-like protein [Pyrenochaeta sp. MPI-SDFR-AT-0127]
MGRRLVLRKPHGELEVEDYAPVRPRESQLQIRNLATSLNHLDWKRIDNNVFIPSFPHVLGMDIAGEIIAGVSERFRIGDVVIARGSVGYSDGCSFQTHVLVEENNCAKIESETPVIEACTIPFSLATAACGLYLGLGLGRIANYCNVPTPVLIWGANGSVGKLAVQLAKLSGHFVIAVTSTESSISAVKARGADVVFTNLDEDIVSRIQAVAPGLRHAFDTVVTMDTVGRISQCVEKPAKISTAIRYLGESDIGIDIVPVFSGEAMGRTATGAPSLAGAELGGWLWKNISAWLQESKITPLESKNIGGLESISAKIDIYNKP